MNEMLQNQSAGWQQGYPQSHFGYGSQGWNQPLIFGYQGNQQSPSWHEKEKTKKIVLDGKYFRRCEKFDVDISKFFLSFDLLVYIGQVDGDLYEQLKSMMKGGYYEGYNPGQDTGMNKGSYDKCKTELYGFVVP